MSFPLFHRPGAIVFLDDDPAYLEMLAMVLPRQWHVKLVLRTQEHLDVPLAWQHHRQHFEVGRVIVKENDGARAMKQGKTHGCACGLVT